MIRRLERRDIPRIREMGFEHEIGPDFIEGLVSVDAQDQPILVAGAWHRAEVHMAVDASWGTPGARHSALQELHEAMESKLKRRNVGQVVTWLEKTCDLRSFRRRLKALSWVQSELQSWHRKVG